ncbi:nuclear transport factor 2 family protein [Isoptericola aurantiacus]|uniref:nuclear transport factor 2 family protein n=1 Tax=Isoptericola aurantiacus TaxID=3377839 RepID=UPI00383AACAC
MSAVVTADAAARTEILAVEERRRAALLAHDLDALDALFDDTLVHVHAPGLIHTKVQLLEHVATRHAYLDITRTDLVVRLVGDDVAVVTGRILNRLRRPDGGERELGGVATQVLARSGDGWRFVSFQMTPDGEQEWGRLPSEIAAQNDGQDENR